MLKKVISIALALVLLTNHLSLGLSSHLCMGEVVETRVVLGSPTLGCQMEADPTPCDLPTREGQQLSKGPCCETTLQSLSSDLDMTGPTTAPLQPLAVAPTVALAWAAPLPQTTTHTAVPNYAPPPLPPPTATTLQVFRL